MRPVIRGPLNMIYNIPMIMLSYVASRRDILKILAGPELYAQLVKKEEAPKQVSSCPVKPC